MERDPTRAGEPAGGASELMASIDTDGGARRLIIADMADSDRWISIPASAGVALAEWR